MTRLLSLFGLMRVSEHKRRTDSFFEQFESLNDDLDEMTAKFKKAIADLERVVSRNQELMFEKGQLAAANSSLRSEINDLRALQEKDIEHG